MTAKSLTLHAAQLGADLQHRKGSLPVPLRVRLDLARQRRTEASGSGAGVWARNWVRLWPRHHGVQLMLALGAIAAVYFGLYRGVAEGFAQLVNCSLDAPSVPVELLEGLLRMLLGWVIFLAIGLATAALLRLDAASDGPPSATPVTAKVPEKDHILGYD